MRQTKTFAILVIVTVLAVVAAMWSQDPGAPVASKGDLLLPGLIEKVNDVKTILAQSNDASLTIKAQGDDWIVLEKMSYPAQPDEIRALLVGAAELRRVEPKTSKSELFPRLEVEDPGEGKDSIGYTFSDAEGNLIAELIVGKRRLLNSSLTKDQYYVRLPAEERAWLVEGKIPKHRAATDWLVTDIVRVDKERVYRTTVRHPDGTVVRAIKAAPGDGSFALMNIPEGAEIASDYNVHALATTLADLDLNDVTNIGAVDFAAADIAVEMETFDGLIVELHSGKRKKDIFFRLNARVNEQLPKELDIVPGMKDDNADQLRQKALAALKDMDAVKKEAEEYNMRWKAWAYRVPRYNLESMQKRVADLVKSVKKDDDTNILRGVQKRQESK